MILLAGAAGWYYGQGQVVIQKEYVEGEVKIIQHVVTVEKTVHPDGTITERTITEDKKQEERTEESRMEQSPAVAQYSLGLQYVSGWGNREFENYKDWSHYQFVGGRRFLGPLWIEVLGSSEQFGLGLRVEF